MKNNPATSSISGYILRLIVRLFSRMKSGCKNKKAVLRWKIPIVWSTTSKVMQLKYMCANVYMENDKNEKKIVTKTEKMFYLCKDYINSIKLD